MAAFVTLAECPNLILLASSKRLGQGFRFRFLSSASQLTSRPRYEDVRMLTTQARRALVRSIQPRPVAILAKDKAHESSVGLLSLETAPVAFRGFHESLTTLKMTKKQENAMKSDPRYQAAQRQRKEMEEKARTGEAGPTSNRRMVMATTPKIMDAGLPPLHQPPPNSIEFWKAPFMRLYNLFRTYVVHPIRVVNIYRKAKMERFTRKEMREAVLDLYIRLNEDRAAGRIDNMHSYLNPIMLSEISAEVSNRPKNPGVEYRWKCESPTFRLKSYRVIAVPPPMMGNYLQVVYQIESKQTMSIVNKKTGEVVGGVQEPVNVVDYVGFEKNIDKADSTWMIVEQLKR